jgi:hypothetical protein
MAKKTDTSTPAEMAPTMPARRANYLRFSFYGGLVLAFLLLACALYIDTETRIAPGSPLYPAKTNLETVEYMASQVSETWPLFLRANLIEKRLLEMLTLSSALSADARDAWPLYRYGDIIMINENINILAIKTKSQIESLDDAARHLPLNTGDDSDEDRNLIRLRVNELSETRKNILRKVLENNGNNLEEQLVAKIRNEVEVEILQSPAASTELPAFLPKAAGPLVPDK